jgi:DNA ligase (NAD+)
LLFEADLVESVPDLYDLTEEELVALEGFGEKSARNLLSELEETKEPALPEFLAALGIPEIGTTTATALAREFGTFGTLRETAEADDRERLQAVDDVGPRVAEAIREFFAAEANREVIDALLAAGVDPQEYEADTGDALAGLTFVFTGSLEAFTRDEAQELVERNGANATSSVSGNTDYLVCGSNPGRTKRDDADAEGVPTLSESAFLELLEEYGIDAGD